MSEHVKTELSNGVLVLTLQRRDKKNALTGAMYNALSDTLDDLQEFSHDDYASISARRTCFCGSRDLVAVTGCSVGTGPRGQATGVDCCSRTGVAR